MPLSILQNLPVGREWVNLLQGINPQIEELQAGQNLYHGVERNDLFDTHTRVLQDRQWFSFVRETARSYADRPGYVLDVKTARNLTLVTLEQSTIVKHEIGQRVLKQVIQSGTLPAAQSQWDLPEVRLKRWYLLSALRFALNRDDIDGWMSPGDEQKELYTLDVSGSVKILNVEFLPATPG